MCFYYYFFLILTYLSHHSGNPRPNSELTKFGRQVSNYQFYLQDTVENAKLDIFIGDMCFFYIDGCVVLQTPAQTAHAVGKWGCQHENCCRRDHCLALWTCQSHGFCKFTAVLLNRSVKCFLSHPVFTRFLKFLNIVKYWFPYFDLSYLCNTTISIYWWWK